MNGSNLISKMAMLAFGGLAFPSYALASVLTFGNTNVDRLDLAGTQSEDSFSYTASGAGWELETTYGHPGAALATFFNGEGSSVGNTVDIMLTGGGLFTFDSVDWKTVGIPGDDVVLEGFLSGGLVDSLTLSADSRAWVTAGGFGGPVDLLRVRITGGLGNSAMVLDNVNLTIVDHVPAPASLTLIALGLAGIRYRRKQRKAA